MANQELIEAQKRTHYPIGEKHLPRVKYGDESQDWHAATIPCHDCGAVQGQFHIPCCDVEECPSCGEQTLSCDCELGDSCAAPSDSN